MNNIPSWAYNVDFPDRVLQTEAEHRPSHSKTK